MRAAGCHRITLDTTVPLQRAIRFYQRHGYAPTGRSPTFSACPSTNTRSTHRLTKHKHQALTSASLLSIV
jgi:hypothetical protein